ncbi:uncharacterized protein Z520_01052 [Fonsecaea multimorphosa CBS 102226]|uniref:Calcineurin-like phosphoesterase domain-containing protein n=1 Tax=Fonsecaea multimorphosa CBS 102226 TaxID=1442371 RepID=A0A0D2IZS1_9EURO|nr:uncharacterized protein Z520_01052 [Fonsecaea multimorphosa CBS 102226]KIY02587.1 hypothetical protein Z520_01052 [Fonsecaea multimorphosa CBS 102226]OAL31453.1 hypothetical protein AYO22_01045 [Fonsecaea multimorphosa]
MYIYEHADKLLRLLTPIAIGLTTYLYLYPLFHGCAFPSRDASPVTALTEAFKQHWAPLGGLDVHPDHARVPFRLLALADPQLEGDSSLPKPEDGLIPKLRQHWAKLSAEDPQHWLSCAYESVQEVVLEDLPEALLALRKRLDLFGNDYYLGHIYRTLHWWTKPTHVAVLGDLIGSQWVTDEEFAWRGWRFWNRVFASAQKVEDDVTSLSAKDQEAIFEMHDAHWNQRLINIAGNHDIGYAGDISRGRIDRFEKVFGRANWDVRFRYPGLNSTEPTTETDIQPSLHLIVLNSLVLDSPALSEDIQTETFEYLNDLISHRLRPVEDPSSFTLLLTHLPLHKKEGTCVDAPFFDYWGDDNGGGVLKPHGVREQNHLSEQTSQRGTLQALFGMSGDIGAPAQGKGRRGLILTGHDHEGCDVWHFIPSESVGSTLENGGEQQQTSWDSCKWQHANHSSAHTGIREITLRSMMGDYGGNAGLLSAWFDFETSEWKYHIQMCGLNIKLWWAVHVVDLVVLCLFGVALCHRPQRTLRKSSTERSDVSDSKSK